MAENRLDRIEKNLGQFMRGMMELRDSQKKTDEQIRELRDSQKETDKQIKELRDSQKETDKQIKELRGSQKDTDKQINELRGSQKDTDKQINELRDSQKDTDKLLKGTIKKLDNIGRQLGDLGLVQGEIAEELFYRNLKHLFRDRKPPFRTVRRNLKRKGVGEYDIVASDGENLLIVEVKNKLKKNMIDDFINRKLPEFKKAFPKYRDFRLTAGIGALVVKNELGRYAEKQGLFVLTQTDDGGAALLNRKTFKAKEFG